MISHEVIKNPQKMFINVLHKNLHTFIRLNKIFMLKVAGQKRKRKKVTSDIFNTKVITFIGRYCIMSDVILNLNCSYYDNNNKCDYCFGTLSNTHLKYVYTSSLDFKNSDSLPLFIVNKACIDEFQRATLLSVYLPGYLLFLLAVSDINSLIGVLPIDILKHIGYCILRIYQKLY